MKDYTGQVALVLQGGGALGAYQVGVYEALHDAGIEPDWVIGTSIGAINGAVIAGNPPERRMQRLEEFWRMVRSDESAKLWGMWPAVANAVAHASIVAKGIDGFFAPNADAAWGMHVPLGVEKAAFYKTSPLRDSLASLVDFGCLNTHRTRLTLGAVNVRTSDMRYFDSRDMALDERHVMASGALPPAFPAVRIDGDPYWDGGIYSNTPVEVVLDDKPRKDTLIFAANVWHATGPEPETLWQVMGRQKDIQYASRATSHVMRQQQIHRMRHIIRELKRHIPDERCADPEVKRMLDYGCATVMHLLPLHAPRLEGEDQSKDIDFTAAGIDARRKAGHADTQRVLAERPWENCADTMDGILIHGSDPMIEKYDAIVIGAGQAGPALAARLGREGLKTAIIERKLLGGTCVNVGCIPTKTLVGSARAIHMARRGADYGFSAGDVRVDMRAVKARKDGIVRQSNDGLASWIAGMKNVTLLWGQARFTGPRTLEVAGRDAGRRTLQADKIFINVGGRAVVPDIPGAKDVPYMTNSQMMEVDQVPGHLLIVGGSYIGLEFAQMYRRFGAKVTVIEKFPKLLPREDEDVVAEIRAILEREGVEIRLGAEDMTISKSNGLISVRFENDKKKTEVQGSHLLYAVGRVPNTDDLGLKEGGIAADPRGFITVDDQCRTSAEGVWALGDVNGKGAFTHTSWNDYEIVAANLFDNDPRKISDRISCYALFIDPPLGRVGMNEAEAKKSGRKLLRGKMPMTRVGRAREMGETQGFMKVLVDADTKELLGAAILGLSGDEVVHSLLDVMYAKKPYTTISRAVHIHPTVSELVPTLLQGLKPVKG